MPTASNLASTTAGASRKKKTPAKPSVPKQKGRKAYPRDENGNMVRPNKENHPTVNKKPTKRHRNYLAKKFWKIVKNNNLIKDNLNIK